MHKVTNVSVLSNIVRLGIEDERAAYATLRQWRRMQALTQDVLKRRSAQHLPWRLQGELPADKTGRLFMSFHYGLWYLVLAALTQGRQGAHYDGPPVYCLISKPHPAYSDRLGAMALAAGIRVEFVPGGIAMVRGVRRAQAEGALLFVLIDVPWGIRSESDLRYPFLGGRIEAKSALFTFAERVGLTPHLLVADFDAPTGESRIVDHGVQNQAACFDLLQRYVGAKPWLWDRLVDLHKYVERPGAVRYLPFRLDGHYYLTEMHSLRIFRVARSLYGEVRLAKRLLASSEPELGARLLKEIHDKSALGIRAVF
jgi:hypothetical protein